MHFLQIVPIIVIKSLSFSVVMIIGLKTTLSDSNLPTTSLLYIYNFYHFTFKYSVYLRLFLKYQFIVSFYFIIQSKYFVTYLEHTVLFNEINDLSMPYSFLVFSPFFLLMIVLLFNFIFVQIYLGIQIQHRYTIEYNIIVDIQIR